MKKFIFFIVFLWPLILYSQDFQWAVSCAKGEMDDFGVISSNAAGDIFLTGNYYPPGIFGNDTLGAGYVPVMLTKISGSGEFQWTKGIKVVGYMCSPTNPFVEASKTSNNVYFFGNICGDNYFDTIHLVSTEDQIFIAKYDGDGNCLWAKEPGNNKTCYITDVTLDSLDNIFIKGWAGDTIIFNGLQVNPGSYIAKFSNSGICEWIKNTKISGGIAYIKNFCVLNDGGLLLSGLTGSSSIIIETDTLHRSSTYGDDLLIIKYNNEGEYMWSKLDGQTGAIIIVADVKPGDHGSFLITGVQSGDTLIFGNYILPNHTNFEAYVVKYDINGDASWATNSHSRIADITPGGLYSSNDGKIFVTGAIEYGYVKDTVYFGSYSLIIDGDAIFVACYDSTGNCIGARFAKNESWGGPTHNMVGTSVTADNNGTSIIAGQFERDAYFDETTLTSMGMKDIFIAKCTPITGEEELKINHQNQLLIYANPNTGKCNITIPEEFNNEKHLTLQIFDINGKLIQQSAVEIMEGKIKMDIQAQAKGMYTAILSNGKKSYTGKIVFE